MKKEACDYNSNVDVCCIFIGRGFNTAETGSQRTIEGLNLPELTMLTGTDEHSGRTDITDKAKWKDLTPKIFVNNGKKQYSKITPH